MKVLFLDFDGVLNNDFHLRKIKNHPSESHHGLDPKNVNVLNQLYKKVPNLNIVISSSWRIGKSIEWLQDLLTDAGFHYSNKIISVTPFSGRGPRGNKIQKWLDQHLDVAEFVIVDDDQDMAHLMGRLVKTSFRYGLQEKHIEEILRVLKEK